VISTWNLSLPAQLPSFDYTTISDVILHIRYTARQGGDQLAAQAAKELTTTLDTAGQALLFCLRYDFPTQWSAFVNGTGDFAVTLDEQFFPYYVQSASNLTIDGLTLYAGSSGTLASVTPSADLNALSEGLRATGQAPLTLPPDSMVMTRDLSQQVFLVLQYGIS
jgi:Tc toxin complex TcA C-terminal TcB-binding domain